MTTPQGTRGRPRLEDVKVYEGVPSEIKALHTKEEFMNIDLLTLRAAKFRLRVTGTILSLGDGLLKLSEPDAFSKRFLGDAETGLPLPITHSDWKPHSRKRDDFGMCEAAGRRTGEEIEKSVIGIVEPFQGRVFGLLNHPGRIQIPLNSRPLPLQIDDAIAELEAKKFYGPYLVFHGNGFDCELESDWLVRSGSGEDPVTMRQAVRKISRERPPTRASVSDSGKYIGEVPQDPVYYPVLDCKRMDWADKDIAVVQATPDVIRIVVGLDITPVRWDDHYKTMAIVVPQVRDNGNGVVGIVHLKR